VVSLQALGTSLYLDTAAKGFATALRDAASIRLILVDPDNTAAKGCALRLQGAAAFAVASDDKKAKPSYLSIGTSGTAFSFSASPSRFRVTLATDEAKRGIVTPESPLLVYPGSSISNVIRAAGKAANGAVRLTKDKASARTRFAIVGAAIRFFEKPMHAPVGNNKAGCLASKPAGAAMELGDRRRRAVLEQEPQCEQMSLLQCKQACEREPDCAAFSRSSDTAADAAGACDWYRAAGVGKGFSANTALNAYTKEGGATGVGPKLASLAIQACTGTSPKSCTAFSFGGFKPKTLEYTFTLPFTSSGLLLAPQAQSKDATVTATVNGEKMDIIATTALAPAKTAKVVITVSAFGKKLAYTLLIHRKGSSDARLAALTTNPLNGVHFCSQPALKPTFGSTILGYHVELPNAVWPASLSFNASLPEGATMTKKVIQLAQALSTGSPNWGQTAPSQADVAKRSGLSIVDAPAFDKGVGSRRLLAAAPPEEWGNQLVRQAMLDSGVKPPGVHWEARIGYTCSHGAATTGKSLEACQQQCIDSPGCYSLSYETKEKRCVIPTTPSKTASAAEKKAMQVQGGPCGPLEYAQHLTGGHYSTTYTREMPHEQASAPANNTVTAEPCVQSPRQKWLLCTASMCWPGGRTDEPTPAAPKAVAARAKPKALTPPTAGPAKKGPKTVPLQASPAYAAPASGKVKKSVTVQHIYTVIAQDGTTSLTYIVSVTNAKRASRDALLCGLKATLWSGDGVKASDLKAVALKPGFSPGMASYSLYYYHIWT